MSLEGRIAVDASFADTASSTSVSGIKKISLTDTVSYTTGSAVCFTGTCSTTLATIDPTSLTYRNAAGSLVAFTTVRRIVLTGTPAVSLHRGTETTAAFGYARADACVVSEINTATVLSYGLKATAGTASYTLVIYGS
mgnify:CR=1 FL=1